MADIWKGAPVASALTEDLRRRAQALLARGVRPTLALLRAGARPGDLSYEAAALKRCEKVGIAVRQFLLPDACTQGQLLAAIDQVNRDETIHGCLLFRPLPDREMEEAAGALLKVEKDVDCMTAGSLASVFTGRGPGYPPCTAQAVMELLDYYGADLPGKRVTVVGRSLVVGRPLAMLLQERNATVTVCHTGTTHLPDACSRSQILISAAGRAGLIGREHLSPGQVVIDVGVNVDEAGRLCGDVDFAAAEAVAAAVTPVPGGVGAVTTAVLCKHVLDASERWAE